MKVVLVGGGLGRSTCLALMAALLECGHDVVQAPPNARDHDELLLRCYSSGAEPVAFSYRKEAWEYESPYSKANKKRDSLRQKLGQKRSRRNWKKK